MGVFDPNEAVANQANAWLTAARNYEPPGPDPGGGPPGGENGENGPLAAGLSWPVLILGGGALASLAYTLTRESE